MRRQRPSIPTQVPLFPPGGSEFRVEPGRPQHQELIASLG
jgi:hypothetical protein